MARLTLFSGAVPAAGTTVSDPITGLGDIGDILVFFNFDYTSGGTSIKTYLQTSLDAGANWHDIVTFAPSNADTKKLFSVNAGAALAPNTTPTDAGLADNTVLDGLVGDALRVKIVVVGTYVSSTLAVTVETKADLSSGVAALDAVSLAALEHTSVTVEAALPAGANVIGGVTVADGSDATQGAKADAAWTSGAGSVVALLKAIHAQLVTIATNTTP